MRNIVKALNLWIQTNGYHSNGVLVNSDRTVSSLA